MVLADYEIEYEDWLNLRLTRFHPTLLKAPVLSDLRGAA